MTSHHSCFIVCKKWKNVKVDEVQESCGLFVLVIVEGGMWMYLSLRLFIARKAGSAFIALYKRIYRIIKEMMTERDTQK